MEIGNITEFGEIRVIDFERRFIQFCEPGSNGVKGCYSMTFEEIEREKIKREKINAIHNQ